MPGVTDLISVLICLISVLSLRLPSVRLGGTLLWGRFANRNNMADLLVWQECQFLCNSHFLFPRDFFPMIEPCCEGNPNVGQVNLSTNVRKIDIFSFSFDLWNWSLLSENIFSLYHCIHYTHIVNLNKNLSISRAFENHRYKNSLSSRKRRHWSLFN